MNEKYEVSACLCVCVSSSACLLVCWCTRCLGSRSVFVCLFAFADEVFVCVSVPAFLCVGVRGVCVIDVFVLIDDKIAST